MKVFVGGPFSSAMEDDGFDAGLKLTVEVVHEAFRRCGCHIFSAHLGERWGEEVEEEILVNRDNRWLGESDIYVAVLPMQFAGQPWRSDGTFIEMGLAIAQDKPVVILMEDPSSISWSYYLRNLPRAEAVAVIDLTDFLKGPDQSVSRLLKAPNVQRVLAAREAIELHLEEDEPSTFILNGMRFIAEPEVFSPKFSQSARWLLENLRMKAGERVLDIGCGTGILGLGGLMLGAQTVTFLDVNPAAVKNAQKNAQLVAPNAEKNFIVSDGLTALDASARFDLFLFNPPYWNRNATSMLERAFYDENYEFLRNVVENLRKHAAPSARLWIVFSDQGDITHLLNLLVESDWTIDDFQVQKAATREKHIRVLVQASANS